MQNLDKILQRSAKVDKPTAKKRKYDSVPTMMFEVFINQKLKMTREELKDRLTAVRLSQTFSDQEIDAMDDKKFAQIYNKTYITITNGVDTGISNSQNNSSFNYRFTDYLLNAKNVNGTLIYSVTKKVS